MLETEPSSATWTSRTTSPARCEDRASRGYCGSGRLTGRFSAFGGGFQTLLGRAGLGEGGFVGGVFVSGGFFAGGFVVEDDFLMGFRVRWVWVGLEVCR